MTTINCEVAKYGHVRQQADREALEPETGASAYSQAAKYGHVKQQADRKALEPETRASPPPPEKNRRPSRLFSITCIHEFANL